MKIIIPGGTGHLGHLIARSLTAANHECVVLTRLEPRHRTRHENIPPGCRAVTWDGRSPGDWVREIDGADAVINLAGRSVDCRYTFANRAAILCSRVHSTLAVGAAIGSVPRPPRVWLQASTATLYAHRFDAPNDEATGILGGAEPDAPPSWRFSVEVAQAWERALAVAPTPGTRRVALRSAMVMGPERGGVFGTFATLCGLGLGRQGSGTQYVSWIHERDFCAAIHWLLAHEEIEGPVNIAAPTPLPNRDFVAALHTALRPPMAVPAPEWLLEVGAFLRRTETELLLKSRRVVPGRLVAAGFESAFPTWPGAVADLVPRWRRRGSSRTTPRHSSSGAPLVTCP